MFPSPVRYFFVSCSGETLWDGGACYFPLLNKCLLFLTLSYNVFFHGFYYIYWVCVHFMTHVWWSGANLRESILSFHHMGSVIETQFYQA